MAEDVPSTAGISGGSLSSSKLKGKGLPIHRLKSAMRSREKIAALDRLMEFIEKLNGEADRGAVVLVEGMRDAMALRKLGFSGSILKYSSGRGLRKVAELADESKKVILLLDFDKYGRAHTGRLSSMLKGRLVDLFYRKELLSIMKGRISSIEELSSFARPEA